ncbi:unnamed protein product [Aureobasidium uvarum]|uniref:BTB domain-containing protein n=1 Tax=Aureobasidium uvarum TaxID=2773716 RepID=A0A9N8PU10_9PEZI|nr:unnamed protein product [Aureobasidium uvarum]
MITVRVGPEKKEFGIHKALICNKSTFFSKALTGSFIEATTCIVNLEHVSVSLFSIFVTWLYNGGLVYVAPPESDRTIRDEFGPLLCKEYNPSPGGQSQEEQEQPSTETAAAAIAASATITTVKDNNSSTSGGGPEEVQEGRPTIKLEDIEDREPEHETSQHQVTRIEEHTQPEDQEHDDAISNVDEENARTWPLDILAKLYILGDFLDVEQFKNDVIDATGSHARTIDEWQQYPTPSRPLIQFVFRETPPQSPLRNIMVHLVVYRQAWYESTATWENMPAEFLARVMVFLGRRVPSKLCRACYSEAITENNLTEANADGVSLKKDKPPFEGSRCFYHEHKTEDNRDRCRKEHQERKTKRKALKAAGLSSGMN